MVQLQFLPKQPAQWTVSSLKFTYPSPTPQPICYTKRLTVQQNVKAMFVSHASDVRHSKSKRVCLSVGRYFQPLQPSRLHISNTKRINKKRKVFGSSTNNTEACNVLSFQITFVNVTCFQQYFSRANTSNSKISFEIKRLQATLWYNA